MAAASLPPSPALPARPSLRNHRHRRVTGKQRTLSWATPPRPAPLGPPSWSTPGPPTPPRHPTVMGATSTPRFPRGSGWKIPAPGLYKFYWPLVTVSRGTFALPAVARHCRHRPPVPPRHVVALLLSRALCSKRGAEAAPTRDTLAQVGAACWRPCDGDRGDLTQRHPAELALSYQYRP